MDDSAMLEIIIVAGLVFVVIVLIALIICLARLDIKDEADDTRRMDEMNRRTGKH